jgi:hypothetical protein
MSLYCAGLRAKSKSISIAVRVSSRHSLIRLANALDWQEMSEIVLPDLKQTARGFWWKGRRLHVRTHLGVLVLQSLLKETDRGIENRVRATPVLQVFTGRGIVPGWKCPDHTKIEEFRNRLRPDTHKRLGFYIVALAQSLGFADLSWMDVDSTVQEANISYPSDAVLMKKLSEKCSRVGQYLKSKGMRLSGKLLPNIEAIRRLSQQYFFLPKNAPIEVRRQCFQVYHAGVKQELRPIIQFLKKMRASRIHRLPWNIRQDIEVIRAQGWRYLLDVAHFVRTHSVAPQKRLSFHAQEVACIRKGKVGKENEFGRVFQLGRVGGNFLIAFGSSSVRMNDKESFPEILAEFRSHFGEQTLSEVGCDKGYYSGKNVQLADQLSIDSQGIQRPVHVKDAPPAEIVRTLRARRSGIEPLIGHVKRYGLGKSRMKRDESTLSSGYRSTLGFNLHQLTRHMNGEFIYA